MAIRDENFGKCMDLCTVIARKSGYNNNLNRYFSRLSNCMKQQTSRKSAMTLVVISERPGQLLVVGGQNFTPDPFYSQKG